LRAFAEFRRGDRKRDIGFLPPALRINSFAVIVPPIAAVTVNHVLAIVFANKTSASTPHTSIPKRSPLSLLMSRSSLQFLESTFAAML
jgi:hypothetical protein